MIREKKLLFNSLILSIGNVVPKTISFITLPILTAYLSKVEYGYYDLISVMVSLLLPILTCQIHTAGFRFLIEEKEVKNNKKIIITNIFTFLFYISIFSFLIMFLLLFKIGFVFRLLISIYLIVEIYYNAIGQIVRGLLNTKIYSFASIVCSFLNLFLILLFVYFFKWGLFGLIICLIFSLLIPCLIMVKKCNLLDYYDKSKINFKIMKKLLNYSWPMIPTAISMWVINASDRLLISIFLGVEANAIYAVARKIPNIITLVQSSFIQAWQESASLAENDEDSYIYYSNMYDLLFRFIVSASIILISVMPILFKILINNQYELALFQMPILVVSMCFYGLASFFGGIYTAKMLTKNVGVTTVISAIINFVVNILLIKIIGLYAASISTLISYFILYLYRMIHIRKFINIKYNFLCNFILITILFAYMIISYIYNFFVYFILFIFSLLIFYLFNKNLINMFFSFFCKVIKRRIKAQ